MLEDKRKTEGDMPHDFLVWEEGKKIRQLRLTVIKVPMNRIRVFPVFGCLELEMERDQRNR